MKLVGNDTDRNTEIITKKKKLAYQFYSSILALFFIFKALFNLEHVQQKFSSLH